MNPPTGPEDHPSNELAGMAVAKLAEVMKERDRLTRDLDRLRAATWKYGKHLSACAIHTVRIPAFSCSCGWLEIRETLAGDALNPTEREALTAERDRLRAELERAGRE